MDTRKGLFLLKENMKIGIVNRGEAAVRFINAVTEFNILHKTGFRPVAFYTTNEQSSLFSKKASEGCLLNDLEGFSELKRNPYTDIDFMMTALKSAGCEAVWVGWGFLSENAEFVERLEREGIVFIGPASGPMLLLGDKVEAKNLAERSEVSILPWSGRPLNDLNDALNEACEIGYPVILKAASGGGGRGIRIVMTSEEMPDKFRAVCEESNNLFGNSRIFMEAMVLNGRHLEVQVAVDIHGNVKTYGVRDCSVQRNNQKIIEETPPPHLSEHLINEMQESAGRLVRAAEYSGVGTVEFIYDMNRSQAFFMEVNPRLQVEHPITEELHGIDLIRIQLLIAMGASIADEGGTRRGYVMEVRLNAEDPARKFLPTPGKILWLQPPHIPGVRFDSGFTEEDLIPSEYDSMIAKVIAKGSSRLHVIGRLEAALSELRVHIEKGTTNRAFLLELLKSNEFRTGGVSTKFVDRFLREERDKPHWNIALAAFAIYQHKRAYSNELANFVGKISRQSAPRDIFNNNGSEIAIKHKNRKYTFQVRTQRNGYIHVYYENIIMVFEYINRFNEICLKTKNGKYDLQMIDRGDFLQIEINGVPYPMEFDSTGVIKASSPSIVLAINVKEGFEVKKGGLLITLEAMKMEIAITAPFDGVIQSIHTRKGEQVFAGQQLIELSVTGEQQESAGESDEEGIIDFCKLDEFYGSDEESRGLLAWETFKREYFSLFTGYDFDKDFLKNYSRMIEICKQRPDLLPDMAKSILTSVLMFVVIEDLFTSENLGLEGMIQGIDFQEVLMHYFLRHEDRESGIPQSFLDKLDKAYQWYPMANPKKNRAATNIIFNIYRSRANIENKKILLKNSLFTLVDIFPEVKDSISLEQLSIRLNELISLTENSSQVLSDAAVHAKYILVDRIKQQENFLKDRLALEFSLNRIITKDDEASRQIEMTDLINSGMEYINDILLFNVENKPKNRPILEAISRKLNFDREITGVEFLVWNNLLFCHVTSSSGDGPYLSIVSIVDNSSYLKDAFDLFQYLKQYENQKTEIILLVIGAEDRDENQVFDTFSKSIPACALFSVGIKTKTIGLSYRTYVFENGRMAEAMRRRGISPLRYRNLRMGRLDNFNVKLIYESPQVHLMRVSAKENEKDVRLFAFIKIPRIQLMLNRKYQTRRIPVLSDVIMEAVNHMKAEQAREERRLHMNRIVVYIAAPITGRLSEAGPFHRTLARRVKGAGLQKIVFYTRHLEHDGKFIEVETVFQNFET
ncbi:MAG: ATP-grasp domain-containing protein, partial [Oligoflexales bacterium]|nr:ATP-grasp domain-containing protein [Oligoflexales bacterium]